MSIEIYGDVTEEEFENYCKNHTTVIINGKIISKKEREIKEKEKQDKINRKERIETIMFSITFFTVIIGFIFICVLPN